MYSGAGVGRVRETASSGGLAANWLVVGGWGLSSGLTCEQDGQTKKVNRKDVIRLVFFLSPQSIAHWFNPASPAQLHSLLYLPHDLHDLQPSNALLRKLFPYCLFALNTYFFFVIVPSPSQMVTCKLSLVSRFQCATLCHQRTKIGGAIEV